MAQSVVCLKFSGFLLFCMQFLALATALKVKLTKIECDDLDGSLLVFEQCRLKALNRYQSSASLHMVLKQKPLNNLTLNGGLYRRASGYRPYMFNETLHFCHFMKNPASRIIWKVFFDTFRESSNINHTCPYDHDLIIQDVILRANMFTLVPFPADEYMAKVIFIVQKTAKAQLQAYFRLDD